MAKIRSVSTQYCDWMLSSMVVVNPISSVSTPGTPCQNPYAWSAQEPLESVPTPTGMDVEETIASPPASWSTHIDAIGVCHDMSFVEEGRGEHIQLQLLRRVAIPTVVG